jgi:hypothetical protein
MSEWSKTSRFTRFYTGLVPTRLNLAQPQWDHTTSLLRFLVPHQGGHLVRLPIPIPILMLFASRVEVVAR